MKLTPFAHAGIAAAYVCAIVLVISASAGIKLDSPVLGILIVLSLLVCSAAIMGALFFYQPARLLTNGKAEEALRFFLHTLAWFAFIMLAVVCVVLFASMR